MLETVSLANLIYARKVSRALYKSDIDQEVTKKQISLKQFQLATTL